MAKSWKCDLCGGAISELGAYAKISLSHYMHVRCLAEQEQEVGRVALLAEQAQKAEQERREQERIHEERAARERAEAERRKEVAERERTNAILAAQKIPMPPRVTPPAAEPKRCVRCKRPIEIPSTEHPNTCGACWNSNAPTKAVADATKPIEKLDETLKRFSLLDMD